MSNIIRYLFALKQTFCKFEYINQYLRDYFEYDIL